MSKEITTERRQEILARQPRTNAAVIRPQSFGELAQFAQMAAKSQMVPKDFQNKPENIMLAVQMGSELGLAPMQALQNIAIVNGRPSVWGDALPGLCRQSGVCQDIREWIEGEGDNMVAYCEATRVGSAPIRQSFSVADAKRANLWRTEPKVKKSGRDGPYETDSGPWYSYPKRMLQMRARGFALRDAFPDVLRGLISAEEARDIPSETFRGTTLDVAPERTTGEHIGDEIPARVMEPPKRTVKQFLDALQAEMSEAMAAADPRAAFDAIVTREDVRRAETTLTNGAKERLDGIVQTAVAQLAELDETQDEAP